MKYFPLTLTLYLMISVASTKAAEITIENIDKDPELTELEQNSDSEQRAVGEWNVSVSLGYGQVESIIGNVDDYDLYILPRISYYGEKFFLENTTMGYSLYEDESLFIDLVGRLNEDGIYIKLDDFGVFSALGIEPPLRNPRLPPPPNVERDISYLGGIAANYSIGEYDLRAGYYHDITDVHYGYEADLHISRNFMLTEQWSLYLSAGAIHKSKKLLNYYYGTTGLESANPFFRYQPNSSGTNYQVKLNSEYTINDSWSWQILFKRTLLADEIKESEVIDRKHTDTYFAGIKYRF